MLWIKKVGRFAVDTEKPKETILILSNSFSLIWLCVCLFDSYFLPLHVYLKILKKIIIFLFLDVLSAKAERGVPPVRERERERERDIH